MSVAPVASEPVPAGTSSRAPAGDAAAFLLALLSAVGAAPAALPALPGTGVPDGTGDLGDAAGAVRGSEGRDSERLGSEHADVPGEGLGAAAGIVANWPLRLGLASLWGPPGTVPGALPGGAGLEASATGPAGGLPGAAVTDTSIPGVSPSADAALGAAGDGAAGAGQAGPVAPAAPAAPAGPAGGAAAVPEVGPGGGPGTDPRADSGAGGEDGAGPRADAVAGPRTVDAGASEAPGLHAGAAGSAPAGPSTSGRPAEAGPVPGALLDRILEAAEQLENRPPPRQMVVEIGDVRLTVSLRGDEVRLAVAGGRQGAELPTVWNRELGAALAARGFSLAGGDRHGSSGGHPRDDLRQQLPPRPGTANRRPAAATDGWRL